MFGRSKAAKNSSVVHNAKGAQFIGVAVTIISEIAFSFLVGWLMYDEFASWGFIASVIAGALVGVMFLLLGLYVYVYREYAVDANKIYAQLRGENPDSRVGWSIFLVVMVMIAESAVAIDRALVLQIENPWARLLFWVIFQVLVFVPFALGKLVHGHVNAKDPHYEERAFYNDLDAAFYSRVRESLPEMSMTDIARLRSGNTTPIVTRVQQEEQRRAAEEAERNYEHPLAQGLRELEIPNAPTNRNGNK